MATKTDPKVENRVIPVTSGWTTWLALENKPTLRVWRSQELAELRAFAATNTAA
jgi:hypothetical protein